MRMSLLVLLSVISFNCGRIDRLNNFFLVGTYTNEHVKTCESVGSVCLYVGCPNQVLVNTINMLVINQVTGFNIHYILLYLIVFSVRGSLHHHQNTVGRIILL